MRTRIPQATAGLLALLIVAGCSAAVGQQPSTTPSASPSAPADSPLPAPSTPVATPKPSVAPSEGPVATPAPTAPPVVRHAIGTVTRATADGVRVRIGPGLDQPLIDEEVFETKQILRGVTLDTGDPVVIQMGPVVVDNISWYWVSDYDNDRVSWLTGGWVAGQYLEYVRDLGTFPQPVVALDGAGQGASRSGSISAALDLAYHLMAVPTDGVASCDITVTLTGVDGTTITLADDTVSKPTMFAEDPAGTQVFPQATAGQARFSVETDCSFAGNLREHTQG